MAEIVYAFFCEDIRQEVHGKITAVGMWGRQCIVPTIPALLRSVSFCVLVHNPEGKAYPFRILLDAPGVELRPEVSTRLEGTLTPASSRSGQLLGFGLAPMRIKAEADVTVTVAVDSEPPIEQRYVLEVRQGALSP